MAGLLAQDILYIWEMGMHWHPVDRALLILAIALPERSRDDLIQLSVGQRDTLLMSVRGQTFGSQLNSFAQCPACQQQLEFSLDLLTMQTVQADQPRETVRIFRWEDWELQVRLLNSLDLAAIAHCRDTHLARNQLIQRCLIHAHCGGDEMSANALPETVIHALATYISKADANSDIQLDLTCFDCGHQWQIVLDILSFFWTELSAQAKRLLREVDALARVYGWRETDILAMSGTRRQLYLEMVTG